MIIAWPFDITWPTDKKDKKLRAEGDILVLQF